MKTIYKIIIAVLVLGVIVALVTIYYVFNKPHRDILDEKTDYKVTSSEIYSEFDKDEQAADAKYLDNVIEVTGPVEDISKNQKGETTFILTAKGAMIGGVQATLKDTVQKVNVTKGDEITVKCRCTGKTLDVVMVDCSLKE